MEGVVDSITRSILADFGGFDFFLTEFVRVTDHLHRPLILERYAPELKLSREGRTPYPAVSNQSGQLKPLLIQFLGSDPGLLAENSAQAAELGFIGIDLNFGCPAPTVNRHDGGATLLKNPDRIFKIIEAVRKAVPLQHSVSAKVRLGFSDTSLRKEIALAVTTAQASWMTVHARTRDEGYRPPAHWNLIGEMLAVAPKLAVVANGEVWSPDDFTQMLKASGCKHAMLGRGALARPNLARLCRELFHSEHTEVEVPSEEWSDVIEALYRFVKACQETKGAGFAAARLKQWLKALSRTFPEAKSLFEFMKVKTLIEPSDLESAQLKSLTTSD